MGEWVSAWRECVRGVWGAIVKYLTMRRVPGEPRRGGEGGCERVCGVWGAIVKYLTIRGAPRGGRAGESASAPD